MRVFRCRVCGDPYIGSSKPSHCPFCGAPDKYMVPASEWVEQPRFSITEVSKANLEHALELETSNALFYQCAYEVSMDVELSSMFRALSKVEAEHASVIRKALSLAKPEDEDNRGRCQALDPGNVTEAHGRETRAISFYSRAAEVATEPRAKEIFTALVEIETTHLELLDGIMSAFPGAANPVS